MNKIRITGWRDGLNKIGMTKTIRAHLGFGLAEGKRCTDLVLGGAEVSLDAPSAEAARLLARELDTLGADVILE